MEPFSIDDVLDKANELGLMIQETEVFQKFRESADVMESNEKAMALLDEYEGRLREIEGRRRIGDIIEQYEMEELKDLSEEVGRNRIIMSYLAAKKEYIALLEKIQQSLMGDSSD